MNSPCTFYCADSQAKPCHLDSVVALLVAATVSLAYYQFVYVPEAIMKPRFSKAILSPAESIQIKIVQGASLESSPRTFVPAEGRAIVGISNRVVWTNTDTTTSHTVTGEGYVDAISGKFDSTEHLGKLIGPGESFEFTFTKTGEYMYYCQPHPHMQGKIVVVDNFS